MKQTNQEKVQAVYEFHVHSNAGYRWVQYIAQAQQGDKDALAAVLTEADRIAALEAK